MYIVYCDLTHHFWARFCEQREPKSPDQKIMGNYPVKIGGGYSGKDFGFSCPEGTYINKIIGRGGNSIDGIQIQCSDGTTSGYYGGNGGTPWIDSNPDGYVGVDGSGMTYADRLSFIRNNGTLTPGYGNPNPKLEVHKNYKCMQGSKLTGVIGKSDYYVNTVLFICKDPAKPLSDADTKWIQSQMYVPPPPTYSGKLTAGELNSLMNYDNSIPNVNTSTAVEPTIAPITTTAVSTTPMPTTAVVAPTITPTITPIVEPTITTMTSIEIAPTFSATVLPVEQPPAPVYVEPNPLYSQPAPVAPAPAPATPSAPIYTAVPTYSEPTSISADHSDIASTSTYTVNNVYSNNDPALNAPLISTNTTNAPNATNSNLSTTLAQTLGTSAAATNQTTTTTSNQTATQNQLPPLTADIPTNIPVNTTADAPAGYSKSMIILFIFIITVVLLAVFMTNRAKTGGGDWVPPRLY